MISRTAEHALRAVVYIAASDGETPVPAARVAEALAVPANYLGKTLNRLARAGVLTSLRGATGGFRLAVPASRLTLGAVVEAFDRLEPNGACMVGDRPCDPRHPCVVHVRWTEVKERVAGVFRETTISDLLGASRGCESNNGGDR